MVRPEKILIYENKKIPEGTPFVLKEILMGRGYLIAIYSFPIYTHRDDELFGQYTGNYDLYKFNFTQIKSQYGKPYILQDYKGRNHSNEPLRYMRGPLNIKIQTVKLAEGDRNTVLSVTNLFTIKSPHPLVGLR